MTEVEKPTTNSDGIDAKSCQRKRNSYFSVTEERNGLPVVQTKKITPTYFKKWSPNKDDRMINSSKLEDHGSFTNDFMTGPGTIGSAFCHRNNHNETTHPLVPTSATGNASGSNLGDSYAESGASAETYGYSDSRANIGWQSRNDRTKSEENETDKCRTWNVLVNKEHDVSSSSDSESILSPIKLKLTSPDDVLPLAQRIKLQHKFGSDSRRQKTRQQHVPQSKAEDPVNGILSRESEKTREIFQKTASQKHQECNIALQRISTVREDAGEPWQLVKSKRSLNVDNQTVSRNKRARVSPIFLKNEIHDSTSSSFNRKRTELDLVQAESINAVPGIPDIIKTTKNSYPNGPHLSLSDREMINLFRSDSSDGDGNLTEEDEDRVRAGQHDPVILDTIKRDVTLRNQQIDKVTSNPVDLDSDGSCSEVPQSISRIAFTSGGSGSKSQKNVNSSVGRDDGVILIDITQSAERGATSGQASPKFQSSYPLRLTNCKNPGSSPMFTRDTQKELPDKIGPVFPKEIRSNVAWDDEVVHIVTTQSADRGTTSEQSSPNFYSDFSPQITSRRNPGSSPVFPRQTWKDITTKNGDTPSCMKPVSQSLVNRERTLKKAHPKSSNLVRAVNQMESNPTSVSTHTTSRSHSRQYLGDQDTISRLLGQRQHVGIQEGGSCSLGISSGSRGTNTSEPDIQEFGS